MLIGTVVGTIGLADIFYLIKTIKKYRELQALIKFLKDSKYLSVADVVKMFEKKEIGIRVPVIIRGLIKAKSSNPDKNILSVITATDIDKTDVLKEYLFEKIPYKEVISKAFSVRPNDPKSISFNLQVNNFFDLGLKQL